MFLDNFFFIFKSHQQTIWPKSKPTFPADFWSEIKIPLENGNSLGLRHSDLSDNLIVLLHGLASDWNTSENLWSALGAHESGWSVAQVLWARNPPTHAGQKQHLEAVLDALEKLYPFKKIYFLGFSMGASVMLNWARGKESESDLRKVQKLIGICPPLDLLGASLRLQKGLSRIYDYRINQTLRAWYPESKVNRWMTVYEIDEKFTSKKHGFKDSHHYYQSCSALHFLNEIKIPLQLVATENDPLVDVQIFKKLSPLLEQKTQIISWGGHLGLGPWMKDFVTELCSPNATL